MAVAEITTIMAAIGGHDEMPDEPTTDIGAAVTIADKADVARERCVTRLWRPDIHDRINWAARDTRLTVDPDRCSIRLELTIDTEIGSVMEFEIFLARMIICRKSAAPGLQPTWSSTTCSCCRSRARRSLRTATPQVGADLPTALGPNRRHRS